MKLRLHSKATATARFIFFTSNYSLGTKEMLFEMGVVKTIN